MRVLLLPNVIRVLRAISSAAAAAGALCLVPLQHRAPIPICAAGQSAIAPCPGAADTVALGHGSQHTFAVSSTGSTAVAYAVSCASTPPVSNCAVAPTVSVPAGGSASITVSYAVQGTPGTGTVILAADGGSADRVAAIVTVVAVPATPIDPRP
jgi:hypothetical protein